MEKFSGYTTAISQNKEVLRVPATAFLVHPFHLASCRHGLSERLCDKVIFRPGYLSLLNACQLGQKVNPTQLTLFQNPFPVVLAGIIGSKKILELFYQPNPGA